MAYTFAKTYLDLVTADGTALVATFAWVRFRDAWHGSAALDVMFPDGRHVSDHALPVPAPVERARSIADAAPTFGDLVVALDPIHGAFAPASPIPEMTWSVLMARGALVARVPGVGELAGDAYVDHVVLTRPTRLCRFHTLSWGRVHLAESSLVTTALEYGDGQRWFAGARWHERGAEPEILGELDDPGVAYQEPRVLVNGSAFVGDRVPRALDRVVARVVGGKTMQTRWLARTHPPGWALYERVTFGRAERSHGTSPARGAVGPALVPP